METPTNSAHTWRFGVFEVDMRNAELRRGGTPVKMREQSFRILVYLLEHAGEMVAREDLRRVLWPSDTFVDFDHSLNTAVMKLRDALGDSTETPLYIETIPKRGYRFIAPVSQPANVGNQLANSGRVSPLPTLNETMSKQEIASSLTETPPARRRTGRMVALIGSVVGLILVVTVVGLRWRAGAPVAENARAVTSLAVLPLKNLSGDPTQEYLADGMTEAVIGRLSMIHGLRVISRTSVMRFKDTQLSAPQIAKTLRVDALVEGSVIREGSRIRVSAQLIRGATDEHFWSEAYDRELGDALTLESEVAQSIASRVEVTVTGEERARLVAARPVSPEVYESYLKGRFARGNSRAEVEKSIAYFEEAIRKDATFAPAYVGLAGAYESLGTIFVGVPPGEVRPKVISAARKALELDPELAEAHVLLANTQQRQWHWAEAETEYRRALELNPNDAAAHLGLADWLLCQGRAEEALVWARRGRELDPFGDSGNGIAEILSDARRYDEAIQEYRSVLAVRPDDAYALWELGVVLIADGQPEVAIPMLEKAASVSDRSPGVIGVLVRAYAHAGRRTDALRLLGELKRRQQSGYVPAGAFVNAYLGLGDNEQAFAWLERGYEEQSNILIYLKVFPFFDPLRGDPRFQDLVHRVGLDQTR
jgi:TolB-like protein/DNA-binding winged helix-turn-helix (wHTH) protein/Flp pilus assembly protein TadD